MKKEEIHLEDIGRILFGQAPPIFLLETFIRTLITYVLLIMIVRWLGKRMSGQLTIMEMTVMLTLGAIVSVPMQVPDRGILQGLLLLICTVLFQRGISLIGFKIGWFEDFTQGKTSLLVKHGVMQLEQMRKDRISRQQLFSELRQKKIFNLGNVDRVYLEASGLMSIFRENKPKPGLSLYPPDDQDILSITKPHITDLKKQVLVCQHCGNVQSENNNENCTNCNERKWTKAII